MISYTIVIYDLFYKGSLPHRKYTDGIPDSWGYATSENGYMNTQLFQRWFADFFIPNCGRERPVVLLMDNCDAHISGEVVKTAIANDVVLVGLRDTPLISYNLLT
jgi:hypothetical protein